MSWRHRQCLDPRFFHVCVCVCSFPFFFFFFFGFHAFSVLRCGYCSMNSNRKCWLLQWTVQICTVHGPTNLFFINFFIKNGSHSTIHTFKNYFATVFSVFSFQFQQNKFYPNTPIIICWNGFFMMEILRF